ncbi:MAG: HAMP domain-containing histidine kinase [Bdellovibrionaceae bacterium]|nr:HAMP domain-containing histidine kinase [Pseudobdellovibrionaceae bacterium]
MESHWLETQYKYLKDTSIPIFLGSLGCATFIYLIVLDANQLQLQNWLISFYSFTTLAYTVFFLLDRFYLPGQRLNTKTNIYWSFLAIVWLHWAYISAIVFPRSDGSSQVFISIMVGGLASAAMPLHLASNKIMRSSILALLVPFAIGALYSGQRYSELLSAIALVYALILLKSGCLLNTLLQSEFTQSEKNKFLAKELENKTLNLISNAQRAMMGDVASGMAHEMNNPLMTILVNIDKLDKLCGESAFCKESAKSTIEKLKTNVERVTRITKNLSYFYTSLQKKEDSIINFYGLVEQIIINHSDKIAKNNIHVITKTIPPYLNTIGNSSDLACAFTHIISNAIDACKNGDSQPWIRIEAAEWHNGIEIRVIDSGSGISKDIQDKIMNPFFTTKDVGDGVGLGLPIARNILHRHGGSIHLDPTSVNTTFIINLPKHSFQKSEAA